MTIFKIQDDIVILCNSRSPNLQRVQNVHSRSEKERGKAPRLADRQIARMTDEMTDRPHDYHRLQTTLFVRTPAHVPSMVSSAF